MPNANNVKAYKCKTCKGVGKLQDGTNCTYCLGSGYIGSDGTYEYILNRAENGKFIITDIKLPDTPEDNYKEETKALSNDTSTKDKEENSKEEWDKRMKRFWINLINVLLVMGLVLSFFLYFFVLKEDKSLISLGVILLCILIILNISKTSIFDNLKETIVRNWNEPKDYLYFLKEKKKRETE